METFTNGLYSGPKYGKNGKNMLAESLMLTIEYLDDSIKEIQKDKDTKLVFEEYLNIINKSVLAFVACTENEVEVYAEDMHNSYDIIEYMANNKNNSLAKRITDSYIKEYIRSFELFPPHSSIANYCNFATAFVSGSIASV